MAELTEDPTATEPAYRPPTAPLEYARGDRVRLHHPGGTRIAVTYDATVTAAYVTGVDQVITTYVLTLDGCDGCVTVTDHQLLFLLRSGGDDG
jgi:hypothetical protein